MTDMLVRPVDYIPGESPPRVRVPLRLWRRLIKLVSEEQGGDTPIEALHENEVARAFARSLRGAIDKRHPREPEYAAGTRGQRHRIDMFSTAPALPVRSKEWTGEELRTIDALLRVLEEGGGVLVKAVGAVD